MRTYRGGCRSLNSGLSCSNAPAATQTPPLVATPNSPTLGWGAGCLSPGWGRELTLPSHFFGGAHFSVKLSLRFRLTTSSFISPDLPTRNQYESSAAEEQYRTSTALAECRVAHPVLGGQ
jgi:hypothetical protein